MDTHFPNLSKSLPYGECNPIVSSCAACLKTLALHEVTVMHDGEHCCLSVECQDSYRKENYDANPIGRLPGTHAVMEHG